jgi:hypothetical protein
MAPLTQTQLNNLVGLPAAIAYQALLLQRESLESFTVHRYASPPRLQDRVPMGSFEQTIVDDARTMSDVALPFWLKLFALCASRGLCSEALLKAAFFHNGPGAETEHARAELESGLLQRVSQEVLLNVSLGSRVIDARSGEMHINMVDFDVVVSDANTEIIVSVCRELMPSGFLVLVSGDSYHAVGTELVEPSERIALLGKALLVSPLVDIFYIGHQLQQRASSIRISKGGRAGQCPVVLRAWNGE